VWIRATARTDRIPQMDLLLLLARAGNQAQLATLDCKATRRRHHRVVGPARAAGPQR
jgi:hypothetical protein